MYNERAGESDKSLCSYVNVLSVMKFQALCDISHKVNPLSCIS